MLIVDRLAGCLCLRDRFVDTLVVNHNTLNHLWCQEVGLVLGECSVVGVREGRRRTVEGRTRVYYSITAKGRRRLEHLTDHWRRISGGVEAVLAGARHA